MRNSQWSPLLEECNAVADLVRSRAYPARWPNSWTVVVHRCCRRRTHPPDEIVELVTIYDRREILRTGVAVDAHWEPLDDAAVWCSEATREGELQDLRSCCGVTRGNRAERAGGERYIARFVGPHDADAG